VLAVLDWEMSTLGDLISDAALMCVPPSAVQRDSREFGMGNADHAGS
jgi:aminoglycoside phosphotransferase (APT) family kinase protein